MTSILDKHSDESRYNALVQNIRAASNGVSTALALLRQHKISRNTTPFVLIAAPITLIAFGLMLRGDARLWLIGISTVIYVGLEVIAPASGKEDRDVISRDMGGASRFNTYADSGTTNAFDEGLFAFAGSDDDQLSSYHHTDSGPMFLVNPASGLPMIDDVIDAGGNVFGCSEWDSGSCSFGVDSSLDFGSVDSDSSIFGSSWDD